MNSVKNNIFTMFFSFTDRIKMPASYPSNVLSCLFSDNELEEVLSLIREHQRDYKLGK